MNKILLAIVTCILYFNSVAIADVYVQPAETILNESIKIGAGTYSYYKFILNKDEQLNLKISVKGKSNNKIDINLVDINNFLLFKANQQYSYFTSVGNSINGQGNLEFVAPQTNIYYLILDNRKALLLSRDVDLNIIKISNTPTQASLAMQKEYENVYANLKQMFIFNDFNINVKTCGVVNAYSNPDITMCIELIDSLKKQNLPKSIGFAFLHETAHSLLYLWNYPTYDNEDVADEIATVLAIMSGHEDIALEAAQYWAEKPLVKTSVYIDDRHTISQQRARNIIKWVNKKPELIGRWINLLAPKMTNEALKKLTTVANAPFSNSIAEEIKKRKLLKEWDIKG